MDFFIRRRNGDLIHSSEIAEQNGLPEDSELTPETAAQYVRRMDDPESVGDGSFWGDINEYLQSGIASIGEGVGGIVTALDPTASDARERGDVPIGDQLARASRGYRRQYADRTMSPEAMEAMSRQGMEQVWDSEAENPLEAPNYRNIGGQLVQSAPLMAPSMGIGAIARGAGANPTVAAGAASATEGALGGGLVATSIDEAIRDIAAFDPETFTSSDIGRQALRDTQGDYARAVELAANRAKELAPLIAGVNTALIGRLGPNWFARPGRQSFVRAIVGSALREGLEETAQSAQEQVATNYGVGNIDPNVELTDDVLPAAVMGGIAGAGMGAGMGGASQVMARMRPAPPPAPPPSPAVQGPVMPPPGGPGASPAGGPGTGNPPGWTAPDTSDAEDADFRERGDGELEGPPGSAPPRQEARTEEPDQTAAAEEQAAQRAREYAARFDGEEPQDANDDEQYAEALRTEFRSLGMAARELPRVKGAKRVVEPVPMYRFSRDMLEADDPDAAAIYAGAVADGRDIKETETFRAYSEADSAMFASEEADEANAAGWGLKVTDIMPDGTENVSYMDIGARDRAEAQANAGKFGIERERWEAQKAKPGPAPETPNEASTLTPEENANTGDIGVRDDVSEPVTGTDVVPSKPVKNLKPGANEALNAYRTKGEQGLQAYLGGLNLTASKSLLKNLGGQVGRQDDLPTTKGKVVQRVRQMAKSADKRGLPEPSANNAARDRAIERLQRGLDSTNRTYADPAERELSVGQYLDSARKLAAEFPDDAEIQTLARKIEEGSKPKPPRKSTLTVVEALADPENKPEKTDKPRSVMGETDAFAAKRPSRQARQEDPEIAEVAPTREQRSPSQIKAALREVAALEDEAYDEAVSKIQLTPEEASAAREAMKTDKGLDNLRQTFNDALASQRKAKKSRQTEEAEPKKKKAEPTKRDRPESPERVRAQREAADKALAQDLSRGQPKNYDTVRRAVEQYLEVERDRMGIRDDTNWFKRWPLARQEALIERTWRAVNGGMKSKVRGRDYAKGKAFGDLNPLQMFSRAERMARAFPEASSTRMHMLRYLEKRVRKAELKFIDMSEFVNGGKTGNPLVDKATREELIEYISKRKLRLTVSYGYGDGSDAAAMYSMFSQPERGDWLDNSKFSSNKAQYVEYSLLGEDIVKHNAIEVGIVIEPGQPGADGSFSHIGPAGTIAAFIASDVPVNLNGEDIVAFGFHQGQTDYHDAKPEQYRDMNDKTKIAKILDLQSRIRSAWPEGRPMAIVASGSIIENPAEHEKTIVISRPPGDGDAYGSMSSITGWGNPDQPGVGGRGLPRDIVAMAQDLEELGRRDYDARDINAPYRETAPELMFRTAFMMAVSSGHPAMLWPTAATVRMYPGHSTYKGTFYDERFPQYAKSWLSEFNPQIIKQPYAYKGGDDSFGSVEEFTSEGMMDESRDIINDLVPNGLETEVEDALTDALSQFSYELAERQPDWERGLQMRGREGSDLPNRFDAPYYEGALIQVKKLALEFIKMNDSYHEALFNDETSPSERDVKKVFTDFAETYLNRYIDVLEEAYDKESGASKEAEIYIMPITQEMREAFLETGVPMFNQAQPEEEGPAIVARDLPLKDKKWINEMERAIKTAAECAAGLGAQMLSPAAAAVTGLGLGGLASAPIASFLAEEGRMASRTSAMFERARELRREWGLESANAYVDEEGTYQAPQFDDDGFVEETAPREYFSPQELAAARDEIYTINGEAVARGDADVSEDDIYRQAVVRRYGLRGGRTPSDAPPGRAREEDRIRIPQ